MDPFSNSIAASLARFISAETGLADVNESLDLIDSGVLDSLLLMSIVVFVESRFGIRSEPQDINPTTFRSIRSLADWVTAQRTPVARSA